MQKLNYFKKTKDLDDKKEGKPILRRAALIDVIKFNNMPMKSYADQKRAWRSKKKGVYKIKDLASWFKLVRRHKVAGG